MMGVPGRPRSEKASVPPGCAPALVAAYELCSADVMHAASRPLHEVRSAAAHGVAFAATAQTWQLCLLAFVLFSLLRQHSRWLVWTALAAFFLAGQLFFVFWQMLMTASSVLLVSLIHIAAKVYYVWSSTWRWYRGGAIARRFVLRRQLRAATSWTAW